MKVTHYLDIDLSRRLPIPQVAVMQGDENTRTVTVALYDNGIAWEPPADVTVSLAFEKPDKTSGWYDTLPTGETAAVISGNEVTITLAPEVLTASGVVHASAVFRDADASQLATFPFRIWVEKNPTAKNNISNSYYRYSSLAEINDVLGSTAPGIALQAAGTSIAVTDAAAGRYLQNLRIFGGRISTATPTPTAPVALDIPTDVMVTVTEPETARSTLLRFKNQLFGIPTNIKDSAYAATHTDAQGQRWISDEIDLSRGMHIRWFQKIVLDGTEGWLFNSGKNSFDLSSGYYTPLSEFGYDTSFNEAFHRCSHFQAVGYYQAADNTVVSTGTGDGLTLRFFHSASNANLDSWKAYLAAQYAAGVPVTVIFRKLNPEKIPIDAEPPLVYGLTTEVTNDAALNMEVSYIVDTKTYIDQKLAAISAAMLNN